MVLSVILRIFFKKQKPYSFLGSILRLKAFFNPSLRFTFPMSNRDNNPLQVYLSFFLKYKNLFIVVFTGTCTLFIEQ